MEILASGMPWLQKWKPIRAIKVSEWLAGDGIVKFGYNTSVSDFTDLPESARFYDTEKYNSLTVW